MCIVWLSINSEAYTSGLSGPVGHPAEVLHCYFFEILKDIFESVDNQNIIGCIKDAHFYN